MSYIEFRKQRNSPMTLRPTQKLPVRFSGAGPGAAARLSARTPLASQTAATAIRDQHAAPGIPAMTRRATSATLSARDPAVKLCGPAVRLVSPAPRAAAHPHPQSEEATA
tara:strand:- start:86 stop:415 length:330 start_codon:yes stop_codon:yes gene_type:complete